MSPHFPNPGPDYWDWRCLVCGDAVAEHTLRWWTFWRKDWWTR